MALAHAIMGALRPSQIVSWVRGDDNPENLTGATMTGKILDVRTGTVRAIAGSLTVLDGEEGSFVWAYDAADVVATGKYMVQFTATFGSSPSPARTILSDWFVHKAL